MIQSKTMELTLESQIEAILFFRGEPVSKKKLSEFLNVSLVEVDTALVLLQKNLTSRGLILVVNEKDAALATAPEASQIIEKITKEELARDIGKAGLETLAIILYRGSASRRDIDYIRGVNSSFILRNLSIRGLIEKAESESGEKGYIYKPSVDLLAHLGVSSLNDLPEFLEVQQELLQAEQSAIAVQSEDTTSQ
jgi:segregation and condensation protein B